VAAVLVVGCIEGEERPALDEVVPRACEDNLAPDTVFTLEAYMKLEVQDRVRANPPRFSLAGPTGTIAVSVDVGEYGELTLTPDQPLPAAADFLLQLDDPGALATEDVFLETTFPVAYTTRDQVRIRNVRATGGNVYISFTQPIDPATVPTSVFSSAGGTAMYIQEPQNVVYFTHARDTGTVRITINTNLRTLAGLPVFTAQQELDVDSEYTLPADPACYAP
jgi:hypothetical protein